MSEPVLDNIEQYRMQMAGICTAALGYWKDGDDIHPDYDTPALREVARLYAKYRELHYAASRSAVPVNLNDPAVQKRLAAQWGYVPAPSAEPQTVEEQSAKWLLAQCKDYQKRAHEAELEVVRLRAALGEK